MHATSPPRRLRRALLFAVVGPLAAAAAWAAAPPARAQTLRAVLEAEVVTLDPHFTTAYITRTFGYQVFDTLFGMDPRGAVRPQMVGEWRVSDDGLAYTFTLRDGLSWHDGAPVTAADCVASIPAGARARRSGAR